MKLPPFVVALVLLCAAPVSATSILLGGVGADPAPSGQITTTVYTGSFAGGAFDTKTTVVDAGGPPGSMVDSVNNFWVKSFLVEWSGGPGLDVSDLDGLSMYRWTHDGNRLDVRLFTTPDDWFYLPTGTKIRDAIGDCFRCFASEGIYTYDRFTVIGNPHWAHITKIQIQMYPASHEGGVGKVQFVTLPVPVPDGGYTGGFLLTDLVALIIIRKRRSQHVR